MFKYLTLFSPEHSRQAIYEERVRVVSLLECHMQLNPCTAHLLLDLQIDSYILDIFLANWV